MSFLRKLTGKVSEVKVTKVDQQLEQLMATALEKRSAGDAQTGVVLGMMELAGFTSLEATIISDVSLKTNKGMQLVFSNGEEELVLSADQNSIKPEYSTISKRYVSSVSFPIDKKELSFLKKKKYKNIRVQHKKHTIDFAV